MSQGPLIVLSADRTLTAGYSLLFEGMVAASQTTTSPLPLVGPLLLPPNRGNAPLGLRRVEAALVASGLSRHEVAVVTQEQLTTAIGPSTRIIAVSAGEPAGRGMNSSTMSAIAGGDIWPQRCFEQLASTVQRAKARAHPSVRVVFGGAGAWQLEQDESLQTRLGIDHVISGYVEANIAELMRQVLDNSSAPRVMKGEWRLQTPIPPILGPSTFGAVEISRGCGLGCSFCTIARTPMAHLPPELIEADARTNIAGGQATISLLSEDFFRYGGDGRSANPSTLIALLERLRQLPGLQMMQVDHANIASAAQFNDGELKRVRELLSVSGQEHLWLNLGVETPIGQLLRQSGASAKTLGCAAENWGESCRQELLRLCDAGFLPLVSLLIGMPGQSLDHVRQTTQWVRSFAGRAVTFFPMLVAPIDGSAGMPRANMKPEHWQLMRECYRFNFKWLPKMIWNHQGCGGVALPKRLLLQATGRSQVVLWNSLFALHQWRSRP